MCLYPGWIRSWWISSATTMTPYSLQISPILRSSSSVQTRPVGFWGEQRKNSLACLAFSRKSSKSTV